MLKFENQWSVHAFDSIHQVQKDHLPKNSEHLIGLFRGYKCEMVLCFFHPCLQPRTIKYTFPSLNSILSRFLNFCLSIIQCLFFLSYLILKPQSHSLLHKLGGGEAGLVLECSPFLCKACPPGRAGSGLQTWDTEPSLLISWPQSGPLWVQRLLVVLAVRWSHEDMCVAF